MLERKGMPQGGFKSAAGQAAYWRMQYESAIGALADLIAEHRETVESQETLIADERERIAQGIEALHYPEAVFAREVQRDAARIARGGGDE